MFSENVNGKFLPTVGAGLYYYEPSWYLGLSVINFLNTEYYDQTLEHLQRTAAEKMHVFLIGGYVFDVSETTKFKPAFLLKGVSGAPVSLDISANFLFDEKFRAGMAWRWGDAVSALLGVQITDALLLGYAYDLTMSNYNVTNKGTHEIMLRFELLQDYRFSSPRFF